MKRVYVFFLISLYLLIGTAYAQEQIKRDPVPLSKTQLKRDPVKLDTNNLKIEEDLIDTSPKPGLHYPLLKGRSYSLKSYLSHKTQSGEGPTFIFNPLNKKVDMLARVWPVKNATDSEQATFKIVDGLANNYYFSFESCVSPGHYLRDLGLGIKIDKKPDNQDSIYAKSLTFDIVPALTGDPFPYISIESYNRRGNYLFAMQPGDQYDHLLGIGSGSSEEFKKSATFRLEFRVTNPPTRFVFREKNPENSDLGDISETEIQGIAHSKTHWYISNKGTIYKTPKNRFESIVKKVDLSNIQGQLGCGFYDHFGDMDFYEGLLYVATTGKNGSLPIVVVFDENLNFKKYAYFPPNKQCGAGWVAINPVTGYLYSSSPYRELHVYDRNFSSGSILTSLYDVSLDFKYGAPSENEWGKVWNQGGAFSPNGVFYYVLDHQEDENCSYTGIHAFLIHGRYSSEITIRGKNNKDENVNFMNEKCDPDWDNTDTEVFCGDRNCRKWEFEGIAIWNLGAGDGQIHMLQLKNHYDDDKVHLFHYWVNNEY
jgi:hypothetical protein